MGLKTATIIISLFKAQTLPTLNIRILIMQVNLLVEQPMLGKTESRRYIGL